MLSFRHPTIIGIEMGGAKFCSFRNRYVRQAGFSLIEMAIVLVIITTVLTLGLGTLNTVLSSSNYAETRKRQDRIKDALIAYLGANKRLPCPDIPNNTNGTPDTSGVTGTEDVSGGICVANFGVIPYATLGLGREVAEDGWQNFFSYRPYSDTPAPACPGTGVNWTVSQCFGAGKLGNLTINDGTVANVSRVVAVIVSHGTNGLGAWTRQGAQNVSPALAPPLCEEAHNSGVTSLTGCNDTTNTMFYKGERDGNDDVVAYLTRDDLIQRLAKQGDILSTAAQMTADKYAIVSSPQISVDSLCAPIVTSPSSVLDPWGNPYTITISGTSFPVTISGGTPPTTISITLAEYKKLTGNDCTPPPPTP